MFDILKQFPAHAADYDQFTLWLNVIGGTSITVGMFILGLLCVVRAKRASKEKYSRNRIRITKLFGWALMACALSRGIDVLCIWANLAILSGYAKLLTGVIIIITIYGLPALFKEASTHEEIKLIKEEMKQTQEKLKEIKDISEKL